VTVGWQPIDGGCTGWLPHMKLRPRQYMLEAYCTTAVCIWWVAEEVADMLEAYCTTAVCIWWVAEQVADVAEWSE
jgi:hypothetical protein